MKIAVYVADQNPSRDRSLGITGYTDGLIHALARRQGIALIAVGSRSSYAPPAGEGVEICRLPLPTHAAIGRLAADNLHPFICPTGTDLWHYPKGHLPLLGRSRKPVVGTVHDLIVQYGADHYPEARSRMAYDYWILVLKRSIPRFDVILTVSKFSEIAIRTFCDRYDLTCPPIWVSYEGFQLETGAIPAPRVTKEDKVVHLASREFCKRTSTLLGFWKRLQTVETNLPRLRMIGPLLDHDRMAAESLPGVELCGRLPRRELETEIAEARALLFFSEIEGFGLPALEAYLLGTPAVYVKATAVEEILGQSTPGGFNLTSFDSFRAALNEALEANRETIAIKAQQLRQRFSWTKCVDDTVAAYASLL